MQTVVIRIIFQRMIMEMKKFLITMRAIKNIGQHVLVQNKLIQNFVHKIIRKCKFLSKKECNIMMLTPH